MRCCGATLAEMGELMENDIRLTGIGRIAASPSASRTRSPRRARSPRRTADDAFRLALNYGGQTEIADAAKAGRRRPRGAARDRRGRRGGAGRAPLPARHAAARPPRADGEQRVSNFLLWQLSYAEIVVSEGVLAGVPRGGARGGDRRVRPPRAPVRRSRPEVPERAPVSARRGLLIRPRGRAGSSGRGPPAVVARPHRTLDLERRRPRAVRRGRRVRGGDDPAARGKARRRRDGGDRLGRALHGGLGVMADDAMAAVTRTCRCVR